MRNDKHQTGINYWLWYALHPRSERWKKLGRPYWSLEAWLSFRDLFLATSEHRRFARNGAPADHTLPKERAHGPKGLHHEHVVPKSVSRRRLLYEGADPAIVLANNLGTVITVGERARLPVSDHPNPDEPWLRYAGSGIRFIPNPAWSGAQRAALIRHELLLADDPSA